MKYVIFIIWFFVLSVSLQAQNEYRLGDVLHKQQVTYKSFDEMNGQDLYWDMSGCKILQSDYQVKIVANRDSSFQAPLSSLESGINYRYVYQGDTLFLKGFKNKFVRIKYDIPIATMRLPLVYNDELQGVYSGKGEDNLERFVRLFGNYNTRVCGKGTLVTLDCDTLKNTLLVHSRRLISSTFSVLQDALGQYQTLDSAPVVVAKDVENYVEKDSDAIVLDDYCWFAPGYRYAVFETVRATRLNNSQTPIFQTAFYHAIDDQANLPSDDVNISIREGLAKRALMHQSRLLANEASSKIVIDDKVCYTIATSGEELLVNIDYRSDEKDKYSVALYNLSGMRVYSKELGLQKRGLCCEQLVISHLSKEVYILTVFINGVPYAKEISVK